MSDVASAAPGRLLLSAVLLAAWIGAAALVAAVVAPAAFAVLPTRALAGALVGRVLPVVFLTGIVVGIAAVALGWGIAAPWPRLRVALPIVAVVACAAAQFVVAPRIATLRAEMGPSIEALPTDDPRRAEFGKLHGISVAMMGAGVLAAGAALTLITVGAWRQR